MKDHFRHSKRITSTRRWQTLRMAVLERDEWACVECGAQKRLEVDHIHPVKTHPQLAYEPGNCQVLCGSCHTRKTRIECGIPALSEDRQAWRKSVLLLMQEGNQPNEHKGKTNA